jgi:hypothetical protein
MDDVDTANAAETIELGDILSTIASVPPDADKDTLVAAIDQTVDSVIAGMDSLDGEEPPPDLLKAAQVTIGFLQACGELGDDDFRAHIKTRAGELQEEFVAAAGAAEEVEKPTHDNFEDAFTDYFCEFILSRLEPFYLEEGDAPFPYVLNPAFSEALEKAIRDQVLPDILSHRRVRGLADSVSQENLHKRFFFIEFSKAEEDNVVRLLWTNVIRDFAAVIESADQATKVDGKKAKKKKGGFFKKKDAAPPPKSVSNRGAKAEAFWKTLADGAKQHSYDAPKAEDMALFAALMDYKIADIDENKTAIRQLLMQEKAPVDDDFGREGAARDHLYKIVERMVPHCGELITLWAYHAYRDIFGPDILRSFIAGQGTTDAQRMRKIPMFWRWLEDDIRAAMARENEDE